jgi:hypothetical protein
VGAIGSWLVTGNAADQIGHLVIEAIREDGIRTFGNRIANNARFRNVREPGGLAEPCLGSGVKANAFHDSQRITIGRLNVSQAKNNAMDVPGYRTRAIGLCSRRLTSWRNCAAVTP